MAVQDLGGLQTNSDYPYDAQDDKCHLNKTLIKVQLSGALNISHDENDMAKWLVANGPISIGINPSDMQFYVRGISHPGNDTCEPNDLHHAVLIVGYGVDILKSIGKPVPYWIIKNSSGADYGEDGYYRVYRGDGTCGVNQEPRSGIVV